MPLEITERQVGAVTMLELRGRVVLEKTDTLGETLKSLIEAGHLKILIECSKVTAIDSRSIGLLAWNLDKVRKGGGGLKLLRPSQRVREALNLVKLHMIESFQTEEEAFASLGETWKQTP